MELDKKLQEVNFDSLILEIPYKPDELFKKATEAYISKNYNESSAYIRNATEMLKMIPIKDSILNIQMDQQINSLNDLAQEIRDRRIFDVNRLEEEFSNTNKLMADFDLNIEKDTRAF